MIDVQSVLDKLQENRKIKEDEIAWQLYQEERYLKQEYETAGDRRPDINPRHSGNFEFCPEWDGAWIIIKEGEREFRWPSSCGKRYCKVCGQRIFASNYASLMDGAELRFAGSKWCLLTLTYRARPRNNPNDKTSMPWKWQRFARQRKADLTSKILIEEGLKLRPQLNELGVYDRVVARAKLMPREWIDYKSECWAEMRKRWNNQIDEPLDYFAAWELTQQGTPHIHAAIRMPKRFESHQGRLLLEQWFRYQWCQVINEVPDEIQVTLVDKGIGRSLGYCLGYSTKDSFFEAPAYAQGMRELGQLLDDEELVEKSRKVNWNYKIRKIDKSQSLPRVLSGVIAKFISTDGEVVNLAARRRDYGKFMYHLAKLEERYGAPQVFPAKYVGLGAMAAFSSWDYFRKHKTRNGEYLRVKAEDQPKFYTYSPDLRETWFQDPANGDLHRCHPRGKEIEELKTWQE